MESQHQSRVELETSSSLEHQPALRTNVRHTSDQDVWCRRPAYVRLASSASDETGRCSDLYHP